MSRRISVADGLPGGGPDHFTRLLQIVAPKPTDLAVVIEAYFDESGTHDDSSVLSVAGFIFESAQAAQLHLEWAQELEKWGLSVFHMVDFAPGNKPYDKIPKETRIAIQTALHKILYKYASLGLAISVVKEDFGRYYPRGTLLKNPFCLCCWICLIVVRDWIEAQGRDVRTTNVAFFLRAAMAIRRMR